MIPTPEKVRLVELLCATGVDEVEVTSFVSAKWVPQLGDGAEVLRGVSELPLPEGGGRGVGSFGSPARMALTADRARALRNAATGPEQALWEYLRNREFMGVKFRRQHPYGPYILDFFCVEKQLAVEVDGRTHRGADAETYDAERDRWIAAHGVEVLRVSNDEVLSNGRAVAYRVRDAAARRPSCKSGVSRDLVSHEPTPQPPPSGRGGLQPMYSALVPNIQGLQGVIDAHRAAGRRIVSKVSVFTAASETFARKNTNASIAETLERFRPVMAGAKREGLLVRAYISCVVACPFEGPIEPRVVGGLAKQLVDMGADEIDLGDTIGAGTEGTVRALLREYAVHVPIHGGRVPVTLHLHDTFGRAAECVQAALDVGVRSFDGAVAGLGGCPYASVNGKRAPGNISTELLVRTVHAAGYETGVDLDALAEAAEYARGIVAMSRGGGA